MRCVITVQKLPSPTSAQRLWLSLMCSSNLYQSPPSKWGPRAPNIDSTLNSGPQVLTAWLAVLLISNLNNFKTRLEYKMRSNHISFTIIPCRENVWLPSSTDTVFIYSCLKTLDKRWMISYTEVFFCSQSCNIIYGCTKKLCTGSSFPSNASNTSNTHQVRSVQL